jgi:glycine C-acetyltransferase
MTSFLAEISARLDGIRDSGLWRREEALTSSQSGRVRFGERRAINLCANNYLGLADHPALVAAAKGALDAAGFEMASVRFICGTQDLHLQLEARLATWLGHEDAILFAACFDANGGLFEPLLGPRDAIVSDALNHGSIIDGIRLCKARRYRFASSDMADLEAQLTRARAEGARHVMIATDGVFSMDGYLANLPAIRALADQFDAVVMVDDCHAAGLIGPRGAGTPAHFGVRADIVTGTLGKALGGGIGGYVAGPRPVIDLLRQRARPYLFSNALPPMVAAASLVAIDLAEQGEDLRARLAANARYWRAGLERLGFTLLPGDHPIIPVMTHDAARAQAMAARLLDLGVLVKGFVFPVVPEGRARIRTQMNAALTTADLDHALEAFATAGRETGLLP